eukprot:scaffold62426_cov72-Phaeocystis_antarctica.AAC.2
MRVVAVTCMTVRIVPHRCELPPRGLVLTVAKRGQGVDACCGGCKETDRLLVRLDEADESRPARIRQRERHVQVGRHPAAAVRGPRGAVVDACVVGRIGAARPRHA